MNPVEHQIQQTRREFLATSANGLGMMGLGALLAEEGSACAAEEGAAAAEAAARWVVPTSDVYDEAQPRVRVLEWQSFLKGGEGGDGDGEGDGGGGAKKGGCM